eukprot:Colp12_sorted_trinity150504_noHs@10006
MALTLFTCRHADAEMGDPDEKRVLSPAGRAGALQLKSFLDGKAIDLVLVSSATRTRQTFELLGLPESVPVHFMEELYLADDNEIMDVIRKKATESTRCILVVGHNPGISDLLYKITPGALSTQWT